LMWCRTGYDKMYATVKEEIEREVQSGRYFKGDDADTSNVDGDIVELQRGHELPEEPELPEESIVDEKAKDGNKIDPSEGEPELRHHAVAEKIEEKSENILKQAPSAIPTSSLDHVEEAQEDFSTNDPPTENEIVANIEEPSSSPEQVEILDEQVVEDHVDHNNDSNSMMYVNKVETSDTREAKKDHVDYSYVHNGSIIHDSITRDDVNEEEENNIDVASVPQREHEDYEDDESEYQVHADATDESIESKVAGNEGVATVQVIESTIGLEF
jgi:hypothetical protein